MLLIGIVHIRVKPQAFIARFAVFDVRLVFRVDNPAGQYHCQNERPNRVHPNLAHG
jgi:hypothetical protein